MKKIIIGVLALVTVSVVGIISSKIAGADDQGKPVINIKAVQEKKDVYKGSKFTLEYNIEPSDIENYMTDNAGVASATIKNNYLDIKNDAEFEVLGVEVDEVKAEQRGTKYILPDFQYKVKSGVILSSETKNVKIEFRANKTMKSVYETFNDRIVYKYDNLKNESISKTPSKTIISVSELIYEGGAVRGEKRNPLTVGLGREFTIEHYIIPGTISKVIGDISTPANFKEKEKRNLIYVIDKAALELEGSNEEVAKESIIKGLEEFKDSGSTASLIIYGEKAEIIKVNNKEIFSINELISEIGKVESTSQSGNLGDAIRKAKIVAEKTSVEDSIVVVSAGDPNYYTQVSEGNSTMLCTIVEKDGFNIEGKEASSEYANKVVNEIAASEEDSTRWYGINYGVSKEEVVLNDIMRKLEGNVAEVKNPYYDDFAKINSKATNPVSLKATFSVVSKHDSIEINEADKIREIELEYDENLKPIDQFITTRLKIVDLKGAEFMGFDVSSEKNIEAKLTVEYNGSTTEVIFNNLKDFEEGEIPVTWWVKAEVPYIINTGLYNGRKQLTGTPKEKDIISDIEEVQWASSQLLDKLSFAELAVENHFGVGIVIKSPVKNKITPVLDIENIVGATNQELKLGVTKLYEIETSGLKEIETGKNEYTLEENKMYLLTIDQYIPAFADALNSVNMIGECFKVGINITNSTTSNQEGNEVIVDEINAENPFEFWGIEVKCVDKPEHF